MTRDDPAKRVCIHRQRRKAEINHRPQKQRLHRDQVIHIIAKPQPDQKRLGRARLIQRTFAPDAFFERVFRTFQQSESFVEARAARYRKRRGTPSLRARITTFRLVMRLTHAIIAKGYWSLLMAYPRAYRNNQALGAAAMPFREFIGLCLNHWHIYCICRGPQDSVMLESRDNAPA